MAVQAAKLCNLSTKQIYNTLKNIRDIEGRLNLVIKFPNNNLCTWHIDSLQDWSVKVCIQLKDQL